MVKYWNACSSTWYRHRIIFLKILILNCQVIYRNFSPEEPGSCAELHPQRLTSFMWSKAEKRPNTSKADPWEAGSALKGAVNSRAGQGGTPGPQAEQSHPRPCSPGQLCFGTKHLLFRRELVERLISCSHDLLLKLPIKWKCVKLESFICSLSFSNTAFPWTYTQLMLWNIDAYPEMRSDEAVSYTKWIKVPTEMSSESFWFCSFGMCCTWMGSEGWVTAVQDC